MYTSHNLHIPITKENSDLIEYTCIYRFLSHVFSGLVWPDLSSLSVGVLKDKDGVDNSLIWYTKLA